MRLNSEAEHEAFSRLIEHIRLSKEECNLLAELQSKPEWRAVAGQLDITLDFLYKIAMTRSN